jgi:hypothetical protein
MFLSPVQFKSKRLEVAGLENKTVLDIELIGSTVGSLQRRAKRMTGLSQAYGHHYAASRDHSQGG